MFEMFEFDVSKIIVNKTVSKLGDNKAIKGMWTIIKWAAAGGVIFLIAQSVGVTYYKYYLKKKPTDAELIHQRAQFLFDTKYVSDEPFTSIRDNDVAWIKNKISSEKALIEKRMFAVVVGPKGVGKTTAVKTAANGLPGVIFSGAIVPGTTKDDIINRVCENVNGFLEHTEKRSTIERAIRIVEAYKIISGGIAPVLIISADLRPLNKEPAALTASARALTETFGLNVLIDASENAMPSDLTLRENILEMEPMKDEMMRELPQFAELFAYLDKTKNYRVVLAVAYGNPALLSVLNSMLEDCAEGDKETVVRRFVEGILVETRISINSLKNSHPGISELLDEFETNPQIERVKVSDKLGTIPDFKNVLRRKDKTWLVPVNRAVVFLLKYNDAVYFDTFKRLIA